MRRGGYRGEEHCKCAKSSCCTEGTNWIPRVRASLESKTLIDNWIKWRIRKDSYVPAVQTVWTAQQWSSRCCISFLSKKRIAWFRSLQRCTVSVHGPRGVSKFNAPIMAMLWIRFDTTWPHWEYGLPKFIHSWFHDIFKAQFIIANEN